MRKTKKMLKAYSKMTDWDRRIEILTLKNQGWSFNMIARKYSISPQAVYDMYSKIKDLTVDKLEYLRELALDK